MQRYRGHFYNWYDTRTLAPLPPAYISTVDSGNLAGYLLTLRAGLTELDRIDADHRRRRCSTGSRTSLDLFEAEIARGDRRDGARRPSPSSSTSCARAPASGRRRSPTGARSSPQHPRAADRSLGVLLHELEEPPLARRRTAPHARLERGRSGSTARQRRSRTPRRARAPGRLDDRVSGCRRRIAVRRCRRSPADRWCDRRSRLAPTGERPAQALDRAARGTPRIWSSAPSASPHSPTIWSRKPSSTSSSTPSASSSRSASTSPTGGSTARTTTRWPPKRGSPASWRSRLGKCPHEHWFKLGRSLTPSGHVARAAVVERVDVRVPDAAAGHAHRIPARCSTRPTTRSSSGRSSTPRGAACRGASPSRRTTRRISRATISTGPSACPASGSSAAWPTTSSSRPTRRCSPRRSRPREVVANLERLRAEGAAGPLRLLRGDRLHAGPAAARIDAAASSLPTYMAHHQGMSLVALDNCLNGSADAAPLPRRPARPGRRAAAAGAHPAPGAAQESADREGRAHAVDARRRRAARSAATSRRTPLSPRAHLLSNGSYAVMVTNAGGGYSRAPGPGDDPLARGHHDRRLGQLLLRPRPRDRRRSGRRRYQPTRARAGRVRSDLRARPRDVPAPSTAASRSAPKSSSRPKTMPSCAACRSPITARESRSSS